MKLGNVATIVQDAISNFSQLFLELLAFKSSESSHTRIFGNPNPQCQCRRALQLIQRCVLSRTCTQQTHWILEV